MHAEEQLVALVEPAESHHTVPHTMSTVNVQEVNG